jgi:hypothetical protein
MAKLKDGDDAKIGDKKVTPYVIDIDIDKKERGVIDQKVAVLESKFTEDDLTKKIASLQAQIDYYQNLLDQVPKE